MAKYPKTRWFGAFFQFGMATIDWGVEEINLLKKMIKHIRGWDGVCPKIFTNISPHDHNLHPLHWSSSRQNGLENDFFDGLVTNLVNDDGIMAFIASARQCTFAKTSLWLKRRLLKRGNFYCRLNLDCSNKKAFFNKWSLLNI